MARLVIGLLGPFLAKLDGAPVTGFESEKVRALLAYLALESADVHQRDKLAGLLWAEMPEVRARSNLSQALYNLTQLLGDAQDGEAFLLRSRSTIGFNMLSDFEVDVFSFSRLLDEIARHGHDPAALCEECAEKLERAIFLYRGDFLEGLSCGAGLAFDEWCLAKRARFNRQAVEALQRLAIHYEQRGELRKALAHAWMQLDLDPLLESAHRQVMRLLADSDQRNLALHQFKQFETLLCEELGVAPEQKTVALYKRIRDGVFPVQRQPVAAHNLPAALTPFIGRQAELKELSQRLQDADCRLLTTLGPGGSGKTRLVLEVSKHKRTDFRHGVYFVRLNSLQSIEAIPPAIMHAIGCPLTEKGNLKMQLVDYLRDKVMLLVLDGFEHLLDGAELIVDLLQAAPQVKILVTSRICLNIKGENIYFLEGLHYLQQPAPVSDILSCEAVQLFMDGAQRIRPDFNPTQDDLQAIQQVCAQVQGMPLGILLASSWVASLEVTQIPVEIERSLDFLSAEWTDVPARQRSLRATYDYSWNLLSRGEQAVLKSLSVFQGGFSASAARAVAGVSAHALRALVNKSLLLRRSSGRYSMHELLRQYSEQKGAEVADEFHVVREKHAQHYAAALTLWARRIESWQQENALAEMDIEVENISQAWNWTAQSGAFPLLDRMLEATCLYFSLRLRYAEGERACRLALEKLASMKPQSMETQTRLRVMIWLSHFTRLLGKNEPAQHLRMKCRDLLEQARLSPLDTRYEQALLSFENGEGIKESEYAASLTHYRHSLLIFDALEENWWAGQAMLNLAICSIQVGDFNATQTWLEQCMESLPLHGDRRSLAKSLRWKGFLHVRRGELEPAVSSMQEAAAIYRSVGDRINNADSMSGLGIILLWAGRYAEAIDLSNQSLQIYQELGDRYQTAFMLGIKGLTLTFRGDYSQAVESFEAAIAQGRAYGFRRLVATSQLGLSWIALIEGEIAKASEAAQESIAEYRQVNQLDELGWALAFWGHVQFIQGASQSAQASIREALQIGVDIKAAMTIYQALGACAVWVGRQGDRQRALELYSLARSNPTLAKSRWFEDIYGRQVAELADGLPAEAAAAAQERGRALDLWETARALIQELS